MSTYVDCSDKMCNFAEVLLLLPREVKKWNWFCRKVRTSCQHYMNPILWITRFWHAGSVKTTNELMRSAKAERLFNIVATAKSYIWNDRSALAERKLILYTMSGLTLYSDHFMLMVLVKPADMKNGIVRMSYSSSCMKAKRMGFLWGLPAVLTGGDNNPLEMWL